MPKVNTRTHNAFLTQTQGEGGGFKINLNLKKLGGRGCENAFEIQVFRIIDRDSEERALVSQPHPQFPSPSPPGVQSSKPHAF